MRTLVWTVAWVGMVAIPLGMATADETQLRAYRSSSPNPYSQPLAPSGCTKLCENDLSPCDPVEFKAADGRCTSPLPGGSF